MTFVPLGGVRWKGALTPQDPPRAQFISNEEQVGTLTVHAKGSQTETQPTSSAVVAAYLQSLLFRLGTTLQLETLEVIEGASRDGTISTLEGLERFSNVSPLVPAGVDSGWSKRTWLSFCRFLSRSQNSGQVYEQI